MSDDLINSQISVKELKYDSANILVEVAKKAIQAKYDINENEIATYYTHLAVVTALPTTDIKTNFIYVVNNGSEGSSSAYIRYNNAWVLIGQTGPDASKLDKLTTSGLHVYTHTGDAQSEVSVDTTLGGTASSSSLITSGAVNAGLADKITKDVNNLTNYTKTTDLGDLAFEDSLASTDLTDSNSLLRTTDIKDNVTTADATKVLSANQGKLLNDRITAVEGRGRFLSAWDATTGKPADLPSDIATKAYTYKTGDYYVVNVAGNKNPSVPTDKTIPAGTTLETWTYFETGTNVAINDTIYFTGSAWSILHTPVTQTVWGGIGGTLSSQTDLQSALDLKQDVLTKGSNIDIVVTGTGASKVTTISATDTTYTNGTGITITGTNNSIAIDTAVVAQKTDLKLTATDTTIDW